MPRAWIVSIGTELTLGQAVDTNGAWFAARLAERGFDIARHITLPDELQSIVAGLREAAENCDVIAVTGGLGPTEDDLTRAALAAAAGAELVRDAASQRQIQEYFDRVRRPMSPANVAQADLPRGASALSNTSGTAPGIWMRIGRALAFALPGVPFEAKRMYAEQIVPRLTAAFTETGGVIASRKLNCFGAGEAAIGERIRDLMQRGRNPEVGTTAQLGVIGIRINARAANLESAGRMLDEMEGELRARFGTLIFGRDDETLAATVGRLLVERRATVCTAESCTAGLAAEHLTRFAGASRFFTGGFVTYSDEAKVALLGVDPALIREKGAVSAEVARSMAAGARTRLGTTYALAITGIAGPAGGSAEKPVGLVYVAVADASAIDAHELRFPEQSPRGVIRERSVASVLNMLRQRIIVEAPSPNR
ncbi:MAG: competence/damage-inducible protein A [Phycisphaerales bacterium]|nr:competence/damage-inducible protein A [Phycisphaerales bacterium]